MSKEKGKTQNKKRKLTRQEKKQIDALIRQSKGDGKPHTAQDSIPFERMYKDGICRLANGRYSKCIEFEDINYQLAQPDDKTAIFEALCDMYNSFDASISVQLSLISRHANKEDFKSSITIAPQNDDFDSIRAEYTEMLQTQLERGNNGLIKTKFLTFTIEAKDIKSARARLPFCRLPRRNFQTVCLPTSWKRKTGLSSICTFRVSTTTKRSRRSSGKSPTLTV